MLINSFERSRNRRGRCFSLTDRDLAVLIFIWRWKAAGTASVHEAVVRPGSPYSAFKALERLESHRYVESVNVEDRRYMAWQLTEKGFRSIQARLGELSEQGYLSEIPWHDRNAMAFHLGEWSTWKLPAVELYTEQEMRRRVADLHPRWVPSTAHHRPDGYTRIRGPKRSHILAFEAELTTKSTSRYESVLRFYRMIREIDRVFWLVDSKSTKAAILRAKETLREEPDNLHVFVDLAEYRSVGWNAVAANERSENLFTIGEFMRGLLGTSLGGCLGPAGGPSRVSVHYDPRKTIGKTKSSPPIQISACP